MRKYRLLIYEGEEDWIENTLEGNHVKDIFETPNGSIKSVTFNSIFALLGFLQTFQDIFSARDSKGENT